MDDLLARFDLQVRRHPVATVVESTGDVVRVMEDAWRGVFWSALDGQTADAAIAREIRRFAGLGPWEWKLYSHDRPADLGHRLRIAGFEAEEEEALLFAPVAHLPHASPLPDGVVVRPVAREEDVALLVRVHDDVFGGHNEPYGRWLLREMATGRTAAVVAMAGDRPISGGRIDFFEGTEFTGLYGGATVEEWRHRGVFRAVVAWRLAAAAARGYRYVQVDASRMSRPILERLGFSFVGTTTPYIHPGT